MVDRRMTEKRPVSGRRTELSVPCESAIGSTSLSSCQIVLKKPDFSQLLNERLVSNYVRKVLLTKVISMGDMTNKSRLEGIASHDFNFV